MHISVQEESVSGVLRRNLERSPLWACPRKVSFRMRTTRYVHFWRQQRIFGERCPPPLLACTASFLWPHFSESSKPSLPGVTGVSLRHWSGRTVHPCNEGPPYLSKLLSMRIHITHQVGQKSKVNLYVFLREGEKQ